MGISGSFNSTSRTAEERRKALDDPKAREMQALVLDLRNNPAAA